MKKTRQEKWLELGYTEEQIKNHREFEARKSKTSRERRNKNNEQNRAIIKKVKEEILGKTFGGGKIISIRPSVDGLGFWFKINRKFDDGSEGDFRYFCYWSDYKLENFESGFMWF